MANLCLLNGRQVATIIAGIQLSWHIPFALLFYLALPPQVGIFFVLAAVAATSPGKKNIVGKSSGSSYLTSLTLSLLRAVN